MFRTCFRQLRGFSQSGHQPSRCSPRPPWGRRPGSRDWFSGLTHQTEKPPRGHGSLCCLCSSGTGRVSAPQAPLVDGGKWPRGRCAELCPGPLAHAALTRAQGSGEATVAWQVRPGAQVCGEWPTPSRVSQTPLCGLRPSSRRCAGLRRGPQLGHAQSLLRVFSVEGRWVRDGTEEGTRGQTGRETSPRDDQRPSGG